MQGSDILIRSAKQNILQIAKWNKILNRLIWVLFFILILFEGILAVCYCLGITLDNKFSNMEYVLSYFIKPALVLLFTILVAKGIDRKFAIRHKTHMRSWLIVFTLIIMSTEVVAFHHGISVIYVIYVIPIMVSLLYARKKMLLTSYLFSIIMYLLVLTYIMTFIPENEYRHNYMDIFGSIAILTAVYAICCMVLFRVQELINTAVDETVLRTQLSHEVTLDPATQLYNHATFYQRLDAFIIAYHQDSTQRFSLILLDIDNFKKINDTYGHSAGDHVILRLVDTIRGHLGKNDLAFRYGGEEFAILTSRPESSSGMAESIREGFAKQIFLDIPHQVTVSIGISTYTYAYSGKREFFSSADKALYKAKRSGKNRVCIAESDSY